MVDLVGVVHIGDAAYYQQLNKEFKAYEAVLYEMVKPQAGQFKPPPSSVGMMQTFMQKQLIWLINWMRWIIRRKISARGHDRETIRKRQEARGESMFKLMFK